MLCCCSALVYAVAAIAVLQTIRWLLSKRCVPNLSQKSVLITGCDSGFGNLLAKKCAKNGLKTFAGCLTDAGIDELTKLGSTYEFGSLKPVKLNVTDEGSVRACLQFVTTELKGEGLWGLVNNAGICVTTIDDWSLIEDYQKSFDVNALGIVRMCQAFKPLVKKARGRIVAVTSVFGRMAFNGMGPYCMSKYAAEAYCDVVRRELYRWGVTVHIVEPGYFKTGLSDPAVHRKIFENRWKSLPQAIRDEYGEAFFRHITESTTKHLEQLCSPNTHMVVDAYYHALTSMNPRKRYYPGWDSSLFWRYYSMMPECIQDGLLRWLEKRQGVPPPAALLQALKDKNE